MFESRRLSIQFFLEHALIQVAEVLHLELTNMTLLTSELLDFCQHLVQPIKCLSPGSPHLNFFLRSILMADDSW